MEEPDETAAPSAPTLGRGSARAGTAAARPRDHNGLSGGGSCKVALSARVSPPINNRKERLPVRSHPSLSISVRRAGACYPPMSIEMKESVELGWIGQLWIGSAIVRHVASLMRWLSYPLTAWLATRRSRGYGSRRLRNCRCTGVFCRTRLALRRKESCSPKGKA
jgi:hypothetical protein